MPAVGDAGLAEIRENEIDITKDQVILQGLRSPLLSTMH